MPLRRSEQWFQNDAEEKCKHLQAALDNAKDLLRSFRLAVDPFAAPPELLKEVDAFLAGDLDE